MPNNVLTKLVIIFIAEQICEKVKSFKKYWDMVWGYPEGCTSSGTFARQVGRSHFLCSFSANVAMIWGVPTHAQTLIPHQFSAKSVE